MNQAELNEVLRKHRMWLRGEEGGRRADLSGWDLRGADLSWSSLSGSDLRGSDLRGSDLSGADLSGANLSGSNLSGSDLAGANLSRSNLSRSNLTGVALKWAIGDGKRIKTLIGMRYHINIWDDMMAIGCQQHRIEEWFSFDDERIAEMDDGALEWWKANKQFLKDFTERVRNEQ